MEPTMKPKLVLHICCAPDEAWVVHSLSGTRELHCFFSNSNIQPEAEYRTRLDEARRVAAHYGVAFSAAPYAPAAWEDAVRDHLHTPEGGSRCAECFRLRLEETARFTRSIGWPSFTTVMSISPHKNVRVLTAEGTRAAHESGVCYEPFDFKKKDGFLGSIRLSRELKLYRQDYCGCRLSLAERTTRAKPR